MLTRSLSLALLFVTLGLSAASADKVIQCAVCDTSDMAGRKCRVCFATIENNKYVFYKCGGPAVPEDKVACMNFGGTTEGKKCTEIEGGATFTCGQCKRYKSYDNCQDDHNGKDAGAPTLNQCRK